MPDGAILGPMAQFRIDQATPGLGTPGESRHDLVPGEVLTLVATSPTGAGVTYTWELLDRVGSTAVLSATTGSSVLVGPAGQINQPCAFLIRLVTNSSGTITESIRIASVRTASLGLRTPLFPETAPAANRLSLNNPDLSTDNAFYPDRSGTGVGEKNWRGWAEWAWEITQAVESLSGAAPSNGIKFHLRNGDNITVAPDYQYITVGAAIIDPGATLVASPGGQIVVL